MFVAQVGYWLPWDPSEKNIEDQEYQETELNNLVKNYKQNKQMKDEYFEQNRQKTLEKAEKENALKKEKLRRLKEEQGLSSKVEETNDSQEKIKELRKVMDEKDSKYSSIMQEKDPWMQHKERSTTEETVVEIANNESVNETLNESVEQEVDINDLDNIL